MPRIPDLRRRLVTALAVAALMTPLGACTATPDPAGSLLPDGWPTGLADGLSAQQQEEIAGDDELSGLPPVLASAVVGSVTVPRGPRGAVARLRAAEAAIHDPGTTPRVLRAAGHLQQVTYRVLGRRAGWDDRVRELLPPRLRGRWRANVRSRREFRKLHGDQLSRTLPAWRIIEPLPAGKLRGLYRKAERRFGVDWEYLAAINLVETRMGRIEGLSTAGATGPMQFLPSTWAECCEGDPTVDEDAILGAAVYLTIRGGPDDMSGALRGYNNSARYVNAVTAYAEVLQDDPAAYAGYHAWDVYFLSAAGLVRMPVGYDEPEAVDAAEWIAANPDARVD